MVVEELKILLYRFCLYLIALILVFSGITKILDPLPMIKSINSANIFSPGLGVIISTIIPLFELTLGISLINNKFTQWALISSAVLFCFFLTFSIYGSIIQIDTDCGCFGNIISSHFNIYMIIRNLFLFVVTLVLFIKRDRHKRNIYNTSISSSQLRC